MHSRWAGVHLFAYRIMDMRWMYDKRQSVTAPGFGKRRGERARDAKKTMEFPPFVGPRATIPEGCGCRHWSGGPDGSGSRCGGRPGTSNLTPIDDAGNSPGIRRQTRPRKASIDPGGCHIAAAL